MNDKFDIVDRFKGTFHKEPKPKEKTTADYIDEMAREYREYVKLENLRKIQMSKITDPFTWPYGDTDVKSPDLSSQCPIVPNQYHHFPTEYDNLELKIVCEHEPVDVGFAKTKMVCKKCDKDLP